MTTEREETEEEKAARQAANVEAGREPDDDGDGEGEGGEPKAEA